MRETPSLPESLIFILGIQRSCTTWLANIFISSPDVLLFMEPFSPPYGIFPDPPHHFYFLERSSSFLDNLLCQQMPGRLLRYKSRVFQKSMTHPFWFRFERECGYCDRGEYRILVDVGFEIQLAYAAFCERTSQVFLDSCLVVRTVTFSYS